jgi:hypothetical protein
MATFEVNWNGAITQVQAGERFFPESFTQQRNIFTVRGGAAGAAMRLTFPAAGPDAMDLVNDVNNFSNGIVQVVVAGFDYDLQPYQYLDADWYWQPREWRVVL